MVIFIFAGSIILFFTAGFVWSEHKGISIVLFISGMVAWVYSFPLIKEALSNA